MNITWLGQSAFLFHHGGGRIIIDPWLNGNPLSPMRASDVGELDALLLTHGHSDHFGDTLEIMERTKAKAVCGPELAWYLVKHGFPRDKRVLPVAHGGTVEVAGLRFTMVNAVHSHAIYGEEWVRSQEFLPGGAPGGYIIRGPQTPTIYHAGDTDVFGDMALIHARYKPKVALLPIGGRFTMDWEGAVQACVLLKPQIVIPMHYNTNPELKVDPRQFVDHMANVCPDTQVMVIRPGESVLIPK